MTHAAPTKYTAAKAIYGAAVGALAAGLTSATAALLPDSQGVVSITAAEWVGIALAVVVALPAVGGTVFAVTNKPVS